MGVTIVRLPIIDSDGHVMEPFSLWQERLPARVPATWRGAGSRSTGVEKVQFFGNPTSFEWSIGSLCTPGALSAAGRLDIDLDTEVDPGVNDPVRRLALMDAQGIGVSVLFPTMTLGLDDLPDQGFVNASAHAYNDWIREFSSADPVRFRWAAVLPLTDLAWAAAELEWAIGAGATTIMLSPIPTPGGQSLGSVDLDPLWARLVEAGMPAVVHAANPASPTLGIVHHLANRAQWQMGVPFQLQLAVMHVIDGGTLERFPELARRLLRGRRRDGCPTGWVAWTRRTTRWRSSRASTGARAREQFRDQCVISGEPADVGLALTVATVGADRVLWASDWPHQDGAWPDPIEILRDRDRSVRGGQARHVRRRPGPLLRHRPRSVDRPAR